MNQCFVPPIADKAPHREEEREKDQGGREKIAQAGRIEGECGM